ncbi:cytosine permease [Viridibacillus sp. FSL R5-0477]|uniref:Permease n=1 Tax=Viridibacillus arenosi FSL R5-213 TaxID=1227360 RepID=W4F353_9BACL|nr:MULTISPECIES: cytosine permease [Viridibacillus]ETT86747.1 permease [Viridibacillus arenosi FSL R5-213]OMC83443.1 cytosine permease [Viridibacillus sp. FSL H8-0123]OMC84431.1 cytosine permease [Viridibacillus sp. FSL H7-0596]OMC89484.1 cytosine permease [Viridibacillus arenosi]
MDEGKKVLDYEREAVPEHLRRSWFSMFSVLVAIGVDLASVLLGAELANGMAMNQAIISVCVGSFLLAILCSICAIVGASTNLSTSMITKYVFGKYGALAFSLVIGISLLGWFGVQVGFFAENAHIILLDSFDVSINVKVLSFIGGILMMTTAIYGFRAIEKLSMWSVPLLLGIMLLTLFLTLKDYSLPVEIQNTGAFTFGSAVSLVISIFIVGATISPDISRWAKSKKDAIISTFFGIFIGNSFMIIIAILLTRYIGTDDMMRIFIILGMAIPGILVLTLAQWTTNTSNLYSSSLGFSIVFPKISKKLLTIILGLIATSLAVLGIFEQFISFLNILAVVIAPIGGIYISEFFIVKTEFNRYKNQLEEQTIVVRSNIAWIIGMVVTFMTTAQPSGLELFSLTTIPSLDGFITGFVVQTVIGKLSSQKASIHQMNVNKHIERGEL